MDTGGKHSYTKKQEILVQYLSTVCRPLSISAYALHGRGGLEPVPADIRREAGYTLSSHGSVVYLFVFFFCRSIPVHRSQVSDQINNLRILFFVYLE